MSEDERAAIHASWVPDDGHRHFLDVRVSLPPSELRGPMLDGNLNAAVPGSSAPRMAETFLEQIDRTGIPYKLVVNAFSSKTILTLDRTHR